jgi:hypothetical protein
MAAIFPAALGLALVTGFVCAAPALAQNNPAPIARPPIESQSVEQLAAGVEHAHPTAALELAKQLFEQGRKDDAVFFLRT